MANDNLTNDKLAAAVVSMRPFLPAKDFDESCRFYEVLGFNVDRYGDALAHVQFGNRDGAFCFLLQKFYVKEFAENLMMHLLVSDLDAWWAHIEGLSLEQQFGVGAPRAPKLESWGLRVAYVFDPVGVLWHVAAEPTPS